MTDARWAALDAHIAAHPVRGTPEEMRAAFAALAPRGPAGRSVTLGDVPCRRFGPDSGAPILWVHGGGLVFGSPETHAAMADALAHLAQRPVIVPACRLAPEHPWPAPLQDVLSALDALDRPADLGGDSAGGLVALHAALQRPGKVRRLMLLSPNTDRTGASTTRMPNSARDAMNDDAQDLALAQLAFGDDPASHPDASPLHSDLTPLPPVFLSAATHEVLLDDTLLLTAALARAGVPATTDIRPGLCHLWMLWPAAHPEARRTLETLAAFATAAP